MIDWHLKDGLGTEGLSQVEAVFNLEALTDRSLLGAGAHGARRDPLGVPDLDAHVADSAADALLPQVEVDGRQGRAGHARVQEGVGHVEHRPLDVRHGVAVVAGDLGQGDLADLHELGLGEADEGVAALVPEPVALPQISEISRGGQRRAD